MDIMLWPFISNTSALPQTLAGSGTWHFAHSGIPRWWTRTVKHMQSWHTWRFAPQVVSQGRRVVCYWGFEFGHHSRSRPHVLLVKEAHDLNSLRVSCT
eukprot:5080977-Amphidinium_carterae.3